MEDRALKIICGCTERVGTEGCRKLRNKDFHYLYLSPHVVALNKSVRMRKAGHVACMRGREIHGVCCWKHNQDRYYLEDIVVDGKIIFKLFIKLEVQEMGTGFIGTRFWLSGT
jgi:hypothetical protein